MSEFTHILTGYITQTESLANNSQKQFYVLFNTNQIKLYTYPDLLKENPLLRKFLKSESTAYFLGEIYLPHTYTTFLNGNFCCNSH